ncbi:GTPase activating protein of Rab-like GTPase [Trypanosoma conorhini]|uniref:GTPase activating protein of Rab-like GTPase n=1 Tax=Trypanosoma conorhini TaxID=83891 RepID=A0A3R7NGH2_9TRYP|nr:GTPase activating protein of Rab-like GTPase [Trypanosoma conorhini]RNF18223.1 GTPase activating protein of Rab-like GTPase [Trypanosoma conorhini]
MQPLRGAGEQSCPEREEAGPRVKDREGSQDVDSYLQKCRRRCVEAGLGNNTVRRAVWGHVVLGHDRAKPMPAVRGAHSLGSSQGPSSETSADTPLPGDAAAESEAEEGDGDDSKTVDSRELPDNCASRVIQVDVQRSLWQLYGDASKRDAMRRVLEDLLQRVLSNNTERHYYQGLHELVGFVMYVTEGASMNVVFAVCERLLQVQWRSFSDKELRQSESMLYAVHALLAEEDTELATTLEACGVAPESHYAVGWIITWYTHVCEENRVLARLFDFLLAHADENTVVFFTAALLLHERERIMGYVREARDAAAEYEDNLMVMASVYKKLTRLPKDVLTMKNSAAVEEILSGTLALHKKHSTCVQQARERFLHGGVNKHGMLTDKRTRNSALKLLWSLLFREWRRPWKDSRISGPLMGAVLLAVAAMALSATNSAFVQRLLHGYFPLGE